MIQSNRSGLNSGSNQFRHFFPARMFGILANGEHLHVLMRAAIFRWTVSFASETARRFVGTSQNLFQNDRVLPVITKIVEVATMHFFPF